jgi:hypothetical protein
MVIPVTDSQTVSQTPTMGRSKVRNMTQTTSRHIRHTMGSRNMLGVRTSRPGHETLGPNAIRARQVEVATRQRERIAGE